MRGKFTWFVLIGFGAACGLIDPVSGPTELYVQNASAFTIEDLVVNDWHIGDLAPGGSAGPRTFATVYRYAAIAMVVDGDSFRLQPVDFVGEEPLGKGEFTYVLTVDGDAFQRWINVEASVGSPH